MSIIKQDYGNLNDIGTQTLIAPVLVGFVSDRAFAIGDEFIINTVLYKATSAIASGNEIIVGTNCEISDTITQQIKDIVTTNLDGGFKMKFFNLNYVRDSGSGNVVTSTAAGGWYFISKADMGITGTLYAVACGKVQGTSGTLDCPGISVYQGSYVYIRTFASLSSINFCGIVFYK